MTGAKEKDRGDFDIEDRLISFAVQVIRTAEELPKCAAANHIAGQIIRCCTSLPPTTARRRQPNLDQIFSTK